MQVYKNGKPLSVNNKINFNPYHNQFSKFSKLTQISFLKIHNINLESNTKTWKDSKCFGKLLYKAFK